MTSLMKREINIRRNRIIGLRKISWQLLELPDSPFIHDEIDRIYSEILEQKNMIMQIYNCCNFHPLDIVFM